MRAVIGVTAALALSAALGACAMRLTDFNFPSFGLTSKDKGDPSLPPEQRQPSSLSQQQ